MDTNRLGLIVQLEVDNTACNDDPWAEITRILKELVDTVESRSSLFPQTIPLKDVNGKTIGVAKIYE